MKIIALICARGNSRGIKNKNLLKFKNTTLLGNAIKQAFRSKYINRVIVSTDSNKIAREALKNKAEVPFVRPSKLAKDNSPEITPSMTKAASGALEIVNYIKVTNLFRTIEKFKKNNFWVYGLDNNVNNFNNNFEVPKKCLFVFGSEGKGLRQLTRKKCDRIISIPIKSNLEFKVESLNVSNACSIVLYEHYKKYN